MLKYTINKYLNLRFEDGDTNIYVNNQLFMHCKYILLNISTENTEISNNINSIDEAVEQFDQSIEFSREMKAKITPEVLFWAHCSNLFATSSLKTFLATRSPALFSSLSNGNAKLLWIIQEL